MHDKAQRANTLRAGSAGAKKTSHSFLKAPPSKHPLGTRSPPAMSRLTPEDVDGFSKAIKELDEGPMKGLRALAAFFKFCFIA